MGCSAQGAPLVMPDTKQMFSSFPFLKQKKRPVWSPLQWALPLPAPRCSARVSLREMKPPEGLRSSTRITPMESFGLRYPVPGWYLGAPRVPSWRCPKEAPGAAKAAGASC